MNLIGQVFVVSLPDLPAASSAAKLGLVVGRQSMNCQRKQKRSNDQRTPVTKLK